MEPQGTHVPVLIAIGKMFPEIKRVMEYGSGEFSTLTFLNRDYFPNLEKLVSTETQKEWAEDTRRRVGDDSRWALILDDEVDPTNDFDLIMVDSLTYQSRQRTIIKLINKGFPGIVVAHDSQDPYYNGFLDRFPNRYKFDPGVKFTDDMRLMPWTDVLSCRRIPGLENLSI